MKRAMMIGVAALMFTSFHLVSASPCGKSGWTVSRANDGSGLLFYVYRETPDLYFALTGKNISFPDGAKGRPQFFIDGVFFQSLLVKPNEFMKAEKPVDDLEILKRHQTYEFEFMQKTPTPLKKFVELGPRVKPAGNGQPSFTFYLWKAVDPLAENGSRQYFLTTVSAGDVVVLSAIVRDQSEDTVLESFIHYANSFQHILRKEDCPEKPK